MGRNRDERELMTKLEIRRLALETASKHCPPDFDASLLIKQAKAIEDYLNGVVPGDDPDAVSPTTSLCGFTVATSGNPSLGVPSYQMFGVLP